MQTNLTKIDGEWAVEVIGDPDEEVFVETFSGREHATNWIRMINTGQAEAPVLKKKGEAKAKSKPKAKKTKAEEPTS